MLRELATVSLRCTASVIAGAVLSLTPIPVAAQSGYTYYLTGNAADAATSNPLGGLLLAGGSTDVDPAMSWFKSQANGGDVVVLRASGSDGYNDYLYSELPGPAIDSVETFVFDQRSAASDTFILDKVNNAEAIFLAGGDQRDYYDFWRGTPLEDAVNQRASAGAVVGGTSAGLAVMGSSAYVALNRSLRSDRALSNPYHRDVTITHDFFSLPQMQGIITDSHFEQRSREGRLLTMMARSLDETGTTPFRGLGINEQTAITVTPDGLATVLGNGSAGSAAFALETTESAEVLAPGQPLTLHGVRVLELAPGDTFDFDTFHADTGIGEAYSFDVVQGVVSVGPAIDPAVDLAGDFNGSGQIEQGDLDLVLQNWGQDAGINAPAGWLSDLPDGVIDQAELDRVLQNWGGTVAPASAGAAVPEPSIALAIGIAGGMARFRRARSAAC